MKKLLAIVLSGVLCMASLCMTACVTEGEVTSEIQEDSVSEVFEHASDEAQESSESGLVEEDNAFIGRMEGRTYINEYFDFYCAMDNDWDISSEEELILANQETILSWDSSVEGVDTISWNDASVKNTLENISIDMQIMEAKAINKALVIMVQKTGLKTAEEYTEFLEDYAENLETQYSTWSDKVEVNVSKTVFKGDQINDSIDVSVEDGGRTTYQKLMFIHKDGYCLTVMAISSLSYEETESFFDWFGYAEDAVIIEAVPEVKYEVDYLIGTVEEHVYTNEAFGFCFSGGESCQYASIEDLQAKTGKSYDQDTLNKLFKWGHCVTVAKAELPSGKLDISAYHRDAEYQEGVTVRGNEELIMQDFEKGASDTFYSYCDQVEIEKCSPESLGEVPIDGFDLKGFYPATGDWKYVRALYIQSDDFFGCIMITAESEEEIQRITDLITKIEN